MARRDEAEAEAQRLTADVEEFRAKVTSVVATLGREVVPTDKLVDEVHRLDSDLQEHGQRRTLHTSLADEIPDLEKHRDHRRRQIKEWRGAIDELVTAAGVADIDEFRRRAQEHEEREALVAKIAECEKNMKKFAGSADMATLRQQLAGESVEGLHAEAAELAERIERTDKELKNLLNDQGQAEARRNELSAADSIAPLRAEQERLRAVLRECAADWGRHAVAQHLLITAKERFEQAHQPEVFKAAGRFFADITGGRYTQVFAPHGGEAIEVIDREDRRKTVDDLSRGTAEQLYLAIRFGYIATDTSPGEKLPILMDDVLVNFDPGRATLAAQSIMAVARDRQVLFFTCHPETVDVLRSLDSGVAVYRLAGNTITRDGTSRAVT